MRHAVFIEPGRVEWREAPDLKLQGPGEALVRPLVVGRCDLDLAYVRGLMPMPQGAPIGHEIIGEVVSLGDDTAGFEIGQRVFVPAQISCGRCDNCRRGLTGRCLSVPFGASYGMGREGGYGGGLADLVRVPYANAMLTPVPHGVDPTTLIGAADMATDAWRAVAPPLAQQPGARVLVIGGMPPVIGLYAAGLATALGAGVVHYLDEDPLRGRVAKIYGATLIEASGDAERYDIVVVAQCTRQALDLAFQVASPGGVITSVAPALDGVPRVDTRTLYHKGVTWVIGRPDCRHGHDGALAAWANCGFRPDLVPTVIANWDDAPEAWTSDTLYVAAVRPGLR